MACSFWLPTSGVVENLIYDGRVPFFADFSADIFILFKLVTAEFQTASYVGLIACDENHVQDRMSTTNGINHGLPLWLRDPDLSRPVQAFIAAGHLVQLK